MRRTSRPVGGGAHAKHWAPQAKGGLAFQQLTAPELSKAIAYSAGTDLQNPERRWLRQAAFTTWAARVPRASSRRSQFRATAMIG